MGDRREGVDVMTDREWKPGDVALVTLKKKNDASVDGVREHVAMRDRVGSWASGTTFGRQIDDDEVKDARPLVVIDPEDDGQVDELREALAYAQSFGEFAAALREFANPTPPRPDEPQGDGALIECDYDGKRGRAVLLGGSWTFYGDALRDHGAYYDDFAAVRILSPGVTS
jgi:hypothetical protein